MKGRRWEMASAASVGKGKEIEVVNLNNLPLELLDIILEHSLLQSILTSSPQKQRDEDVIKSLASVDVCWSQRITKTRFKNRIWRRLKDHNRKAQKRSAIISNNRNYLLECIKPSDKLIASMLFLRSITKKQQDFILTQRSKRSRNAELLCILRHFDQTKYLNFVRSLRQTNQNTVANIVDRGGAVIKVIIKARESCWDTQLLQQTIKELQDRLQSISNQTDKLISQLKQIGIEIVKMKYKLGIQTAVVWMWCRSQAALEYLKKLYELNRMTELFAGTIHSIVINVDGNQFKKSIVERSIENSFAGKLDVEEDENPAGVTKLLNEIYVLCQTHSFEPTFTRNVIRVFGDRNPFRLQRIIEIREIESSIAYIESSEKENCLYLSHPEGNCVWKITRDGHSKMKWLTTDYKPFFMSVSSNGNLLVIGFLSVLNIYGSDAELIKSIQLPEDFKYPQHAVETEKGNFIVLHKWRDQKEPEGGSKGLNSPWVVSELTRNGQMVIRRFNPSDGAQKLNFPTNFAIDSSDGVIVADGQNRRVIRLDSDFEWNQVICPTGEQSEGFISVPKCCCYDKENTQLVVNIETGANVYTLSRELLTFNIDSIFCQMVSP